MSRTSWIVARNLVAGTSIGVLLVAAGLGLRRIIAADPLKRFKTDTQSESLPAAVMTNSDWRVYSGSTLVAEAHVKESRVGQDKNTVQLTAVSAGKYYDKSKLAFGFEAESATYFNDLNSIAGTGKSRVYGDQMDLSTNDFHYDPKTKSLIIPTGVKGKLRGGDVIADRLTYKLENKSFEIGMFKWEGKPDQDETKKRWMIQSLDKTQTATSVGDVKTFGKARASDGEIIVLADSGTYNQKSDVLEVKGHVQYFGKDANLTCDHATVYRKEKRAVLVGNVDMLVKPKSSAKPEEIKIPPITPVVPESILKTRPKEAPGDSASPDKEETIRSGKNVRDYPIAVKASTIEYFYAKGNRHAKITGSPQARQEVGLDGWRMLWADSAFYDGEKETLELKSKSGEATVRMLNSIGDDWHSITLLVSTKEGDDNMEATGATYETFLDDDDVKGESKENGGAKDTKKPPPSLNGPIKKGG